MKINWRILTYMFIWMNMVTNELALKCWKCISHDCETGLEDNYKASEVTCEEGQKCMKVRYRMFDNVTHYDSVIRTCTAGPCLATTQDEFQKCLATPKLYMISGCSLRTCCVDRDLCNNGPHANISKTLMVVSYFIVVILSRVSRTTTSLLTDT